MAPARDAGERAYLRQRMLVENAAPKRLNSHLENVPADAEYKHQRRRKPYEGAAFSC